MKTAIIRLYNPGAAPCSSFDEQVNLGTAKFSINYDITTTQPPRIHFGISDGKTLTLNLPTFDTLILKEFISASGYSETIYKADGTQPMASDFGVADPSAELIFEFDKDAEQIRVFSGSKTAARVPLAKTSTFATIGLSPTDDSFRISLVTDSDPTCKVVEPEAGKCNMYHFFF